MARQRAGHRRGFGAPRRGARTRDDRELVEHHGDVLDEDRVGHLAVGVQALDHVSGVAQRLFVLAVLRPRQLDVNRHPRLMRQLAGTEGCAHFPRNRDPRRHAVIIVGGANDPRA